MQSNDAGSLLVVLYIPVGITPAAVKKHTPTGYVQKVAQLPPNRAVKW